MSCNNLDDDFIGRELHHRKKDYPEDYPNRNKEIPENLEELIKEAIKHAEGILDNPSRTNEANLCYAFEWSSLMDKIYNLAHAQSEDKTYDGIREHLFRLYREPHSCNGYTLGDIMSFIYKVIDYKCTTLTEVCRSKTNESCTTPNPAFVVAEEFMLSDNVIGGFGDPNDLSSKRVQSLKDLWSRFNTVYGLRSVCEI